MVDCIDTLYQFAMILTGDSLEAQDLAAETCIRHYRQSTSNTLRNGENTKILLLSLLRKLWLDRRKKTTASQTFESAVDDKKTNLVLEPHESHRTLSKCTIDSERIREAIYQLPIECREVLLLKEFENLSRPEIAKVMDCSIDSVTAELASARDKLRGLLTITV